MVHDRANWLIGMRRTALALTAADVVVCILRYPGGSRAKCHALAQPQHPVADADHQSDRGAADQSGYHRVGQNATRQIRRASGRRRFRMRASRRTFRRPAATPIATAAANARTSRSSSIAAANHNGGGAGKSARNGKNGGAGRNAPLAALNPTAIPNEFVAEIDGSLSDAQADALARRHGLVRLQSQNFPLIGATIGLFRITDGRPVEKVRREFAAPPACARCS